MREVPSGLIGYASAALSWWMGGRWEIQTRDNFLHNPVEVVSTLRLLGSGCKQLLRFDLPRCKFAEIRTRMPRGILHQDIARKSWINKEALTNDFITRRERG